MPSGRRGAPSSASEQPVKKQSKWTPTEDATIIELRGGGMKWEEISRRLPGRSAISCRLHYQNYLERRSEWDEDRKNKLARLYERFKAEMWSKVAEELQVPWRAAEAMHWLLGEADMARRAGVTPFSLAAAVNAEGAQGTARHSPQRMHGPTAPQGVYARDVIQMPPRDMHSRGQSVPTVPPGAGNAPRREAYTTQAPPPTLAPAPPHAPPPAPAAVAAAAAAMAPKPVYHQAQKIEYAKTDYGEPSFAPMPGPGLAPIQHQPAQRTADYLPGIAELTTGVRPFSRGPPGPTGSGAPPTASTGPGFPGYSTHNPDSMRQKRRASSDAMPREDVQRRRIG